MSRAPALYLVADRGFLGSDEAWLERIAEVAEAVSDLAASVMLQLRVKELSGPDRRRLLAEGLERARVASVPVLANGTEDEARGLGFDGVHWPESVVPPSRPAPTGTGEDPGFVRGASVHSVGAARLAVAAGAEFLVFGPVFSPGSKPGSGVGITALEEIVQAARVPVVAIGGVTARRARACRAAGAWGVAVVSAVFSPEVPAATAMKELLAAVRERPR